MGIRSKLRQLYSLGLSDQLNTYEACKLQIINRLTLLCIGLDLLLIFTNLLFLNWSGIYIDIVALFVMLLPVLALNYHKKYNAAIYVFLIGYFLAVLAGTIVAIKEGRPNGVEYLFIPGAVAVIILLNGVGQVITFAFFLIALMLMHYLRYISEDREIAKVFFQMTVMTCIGFAGIYYFISYFKTQLIEALSKTELLNEDLTIKEHALSESNRTKDKLFSIVAHDLRSPLSLIQSLLDPQMVASLEKDRYLEYQEVIRSRIKVMQQTMHDLLSWAQSQMENFEIKPAEVKVSIEIQKVEGLYAKMIEEKSITFQYDSSSDLVVIADKDHLNIIIRNIVHNALKFTPSGGSIKITLSTKVNYASLIIEDSGVGMSTEKIEKFLKGKYIQSNAGTAGEKGSGVGLTFCHDLILKNAGSLNITSEQGVGTKFEIYLPSKL